MAELKLSDGKILKYRQPNVLELFQMRDVCNLEEGDSGYKRLKNGLEFLRDFCDEKEFDKANAKVENLTILADWVISIWKGEVSEKEKKS